MRRDWKNGVSGRIRSDLIEVFKMHRGLTKIPFDRFFELKNDHRTRGHPLKLVKMQNWPKTALLWEDGTTWALKPLNLLHWVLSRRRLTSFGKQGKVYSGTDKFQRPIHPLVEEAKPGEISQPTKTVLVDRLLGRGHVPLTDTIDVNYFSRYFAEKVDKMRHWRRSTGLHCTETGRYSLARLNC